MSLWNHHHHHVPLARIFLTLSRHFSLLFISSGRSSGLHPVSSHSCCMYVLAGRLAFARPYVEVYRSTTLMSSSLLLQQSPACLVRLTWIVFAMGGRWPYRWCFMKYSSFFLGNTVYVLMKCFACVYKVLHIFFIKHYTGFYLILHYFYKIV